MDDNDKKYVVAVELDGVICNNRQKSNSYFGDITNGAINFLNDIGKFARVIIYTDRVNLENNQNDQQLRRTILDIKQFLDSNNLYYDNIHCGQGKPFADAYVDPKAVYIPNNPRINDFFETVQTIKKMCKS